MRRVLTDTNVLLAAVVFPEGIAAEAFWYAVDQERLVLTEYIIDEAGSVVDRKWPDRRDAFESLLESISYDELHAETSGILIRDAKDQPILDAALSGGVDVILTGDKDFHALGLVAPLVLTPRQYLDSARR